MKFTERTLRVLKNAEKEARRTNKIVHPAHLLLGVLLERTSVCAELNINYPKLWNTLNERVNEIYFDNAENGVNHELFTINISRTTEQVLEIANNRMEQFNQIFLNEGHLVYAIFRNKDRSTNLIFDGIDTSSILEIVSHPRDMAVSLRDYSFPDMLTSNITFRKIEQYDATSLKNFVEKEFGDKWLDSIENGLLARNIPIFIALDDEKIVGFACFDVVRNKKGLFGPMGTNYSKGGQGVGYTLLHLCLNEMNAIGYEYVVIGEAGPIEYYEKACNAVVIPMPLNSK